MPNSISIERLREVLIYSESTGEFQWKETLSRRVVAGKVAGFVCKKTGTRLIDIDGKTYTAPRLAWYFCYGKLPGRQVLMRDGNRSNTAKANLILTPDGSEILTAELLREEYDYSPVSGKFTRKQTRGPGKIGSEVGCKMNNGYLAIRACGKLFLAHRLAWLYVYSQWPQFQVDHINGKRDDNRIENLRDATAQINSQNTRHGRGKTGLLGAHIRDDHFRSSIRVDGRLMNLGTFLAAPEAHETYISAKRQLHAGCTI